MLNLIGICDLDKSKHSLNYLLDELSIDKITLFEDIDSEELDKFKIILFVLDSTNIGNKFFLDKINKIVKERQNTKSIYFTIDGIEKLSKKEILKLELELEKALSQSIENPKISVISTNLASVYKRYKLNSLSLVDIKKDKSIVFEDEDGFPISSNQINEEYVCKFWKISNIDQLIKSITEDIESLVSININKQHWCVFGDKQSGKSLLIENLKNIYNDAVLLECNDIDQINTSISEGVLIVLTNNHQQNKKILDSIKYEFSDCKKVVVVNKIDEFMYEGESLENFKIKAKQYVYESLNIDTIFISSYYIKKWMDFKNEIITEDDVLLDNDIILFDKYNMPIVKFRSNKEFFDIFREQNYIKELYKMGDLICLNHLQKKNKKC